MGNNDKKPAFLKDAPLSRALDYAYRKSSGAIKTQEDVKEAIEAAYALFIYFCKNDYIFYLRVNNLFDELFRYLNELVPNQKTAVHQKEAKQVEPREFTTTVQKTIESSDQSRVINKIIEDLNRVTHQQKHSQLDLWILTSQQLAQVKFEHYSAIRDNRYHAHVALVRVLNNAVNDASFKSNPHYEDLLRACEQEKRNLNLMQSEMAKKHINLDGSKNIEAMHQSSDKISEGYESAKANILALLQKPGLGAYKKQADDVINQADDKLGIINTKYNAMIEALEIKLQTFCVDSKLEQKNIFSALAALIVQTQKEMNDNLSPHEHAAFNNLVKSINQHKKSIDSVTTPEALQAILGLCAEDLRRFMDKVKDNPHLSTILSKLKSIDGLLSTQAHRVTQASEQPSVPPVIDSAQEYIDKPSAPKSDFEMVIKSSGESLLAASATVKYRDEFAILRMDVGDQSNDLDNPIALFLSEVEYNFKLGKKSMDEDEFKDELDDLTKIDKLLGEMKMDLGVSKDVLYKKLETITIKISDLKRDYPENNYFSEADSLLKQLKSKLDEPDISSSASPKK